MSVIIGGTTGAIIGAGAIAGVTGAAISAYGANKAAGKQADAANRATDIQNDQWQQTQSNMKPYLDLGTSSISPLLKAMGYTTTQNPDGSYSISGVDTSNPLMQRFAAPTAAEAEATPGYQFTLQQGLKATQNSAASRGLGTSGAALKGASTYATGLADSTYNDVYNRALNTYKTNYGAASDGAARLQGIVSNGQNAAGGLGALGAQTASNIGNTITSGANAQAAGTIGGANALTSALGGIGNNAMIYGLMQNNAGGSAGGSSVPQSVINQANTATDKIGALNSLMNWTSPG
jgi:hypothetical protein